jgi:hypothetical protein
VTRIVPRLVCERFPRYVIVERNERRKRRYWTGTTWSPRLRESRLYCRVEEVHQVINARFEPPTFWN